MIKYENVSAEFLCKDVNYPFNITKEDGSVIQNFFEDIIKKVMQDATNDTENSVRFIWIDAESYCQTEVFLKRILQSQEDYHVLYLHWLDYRYTPITPFSQIMKEKQDGQHFLTIKTPKIFIIDHAEIIEKKEHFFELCKGLRNKMSVIIFLSKKEGAGISYWKNLISETIKNNDCELLAGILRSEEYYFKVLPYNRDIVKSIIQQAINNKDIKEASLRLVDTLSVELYKPYYFDHFINRLRQYKEVKDLPSIFNDTSLLSEISCNVLNGIISHLSAETTFSGYIEAYYDSDFVKKFPLGPQRRIPRDCYAWAYGIIKYADNETDYYNNVIKTRTKKRYEDDTSPFDTFLEINCNIVKEIKNNNETNKKFVLSDYLLTLKNYDPDGVQTCAMLLNSCFDDISSEIRELLFVEICRHYSEPLSDKNKIRSRFLLGIEIGKLLPRMNNKKAIEGLGYLFEDIKDNYVLPKCNENGIAVIPVTNFEYMKFVKDGGYVHWYKQDHPDDLRKVAAEYYMEIFDFIIRTLTEANRKDSACLAVLLKGYDWHHYKQIAYLFSNRDILSKANIYDAIKDYYPSSLSRPAEWENDTNENVSQPFCNPLQPVVCVNLFEARAYINWLSDKIKKPVRLLVYDPDYLSIIGLIEDSNNNELRTNFLKYIQKRHDFFNSVENSIYFYGKNDIDIKEPAPVAATNFTFSGIFDFIGNTFETQDTPFRYNYGEYSEKDSNEKLAQLRRGKNSYRIDYNCAGGGLQRNQANWPPEYMGQVPAFLRNQDISFRIVIEGKDIGTQEHKGKNIKLTEYNEKNIIEEFKPAPNNNCQIFENITIEYEDSSKNFNNFFLKSDIYNCGDKNIIFFTRNDKKGNRYIEFIMLVLNGDNIFAYHLRGISSVETDSTDTAIIKIISRKPDTPENLTTRKKRRNQKCANWIDLVEMCLNGTVFSSLACPLNISNGIFEIFERKVRREINNGVEIKRKTALSGLYRIKFYENSLTSKNSYYDELKNKIGIDCFLPDWIDVVDYIKHIAQPISSTGELDIKTIMAAITTIDTAHLHEEINKKLLNAGENP